MRKFLRPLLFILPIMAAGPAWAQAVNPGSALDVAGHGSMTCGEFTSLNPIEQDRIAREISASGPPQSLTGANNPGPLLVGQLVSACQGAQPESTLREAYAENRLNR
jgi:hypothetical protein